MPSDSLGLAPEIHELLLDIARDKDSTLLRVPQGKLPAYAASGGQAGTTALNSAERHLMQTHRVEVALALRDLCRARLWEHPQARYHLMRPVTRTTFFEVPEQATSVARGLRALEPLRTLDEATGIAELLEACLQSPNAQGPSTTQLAAASLRLEPTDQARIYCAIDAKYEEDPDNALRILRTVLGSRPSPELRAYALTNVGSVETDRQNWTTAFEAYQESAATLNDRPSALMSGLLVSAFAGDFAGGEALGRRIDEEYDEHHPAIRSFSMFVRSSYIGHRPGEATPELSFYAKLARNSRGPTARILNEINA